MNDLVLPEFPTSDEETKVSSDLNLPDFGELALPVFENVDQVVEEEERAGLLPSAFGALEVGATFLTSAAAEPVAGLSGLVASPFVGTERGSELVDDVRQTLSYQPLSETGQGYLENIGEFLAPAIEAFEAASSTIGDAAFETTGSPLAGAIGYSIPTAVLEAIGLKGSKGIMAARRNRKTGEIEPIGGKPVSKKEMVKRSKKALKEVRKQGEDEALYDYLVTPVRDVISMKAGDDVGGRWDRAVTTASRKQDLIQGELAVELGDHIALLAKDRQLKAAFLDLHRDVASNKTIIMNRIRNQLGEEAAQKMEKFFKLNDVKSAEARKRIYLPDEKIQTEGYIHSQVRGDGGAPRKVGRRSKRGSNPVEQPAALQARSRKSAHKMTDAEIDRYENPLLSHLKYLGDQEQLLEIAKKFDMEPSLALKGNTRDFFKEVAKSLQREGKTREAANTAASLMHDAFLGARNSPHPLIQAFMAQSYASTLGNPYSATLNLHDPFVSAYVNGVGNTVKGLPQTTKQLFGRNLQDMGIGKTQQTGEFVRNFMDLSDNPTRWDAAVKGSHWVQDKAFKYSGFQATDRASKGTVLRATLNSATEAAKKGRLAEEFGHLLRPDELERAQKALTSGKKPKDLPPAQRKLVEEIAFAGLGRQQLISYAGRPMAYLDHPNARPLYAMTGFAVIQQALLRRRIGSLMKEGKYAQAGADAAKYVATAGLGYGLIHEARQQFKPDEEFDTDAVLMGTVDQVAAAITLNRLGDDYSRNHFQREPLEFLISSFIPPTGIVGASVHDVSDMVMKGEYNARVAKQVPVVGRFYDWYWDGKD